jgi:hypothetical protein
MGPDRAGAQGRTLESAALSTPTIMDTPPTLHVAVVFERQRDPSPWEAWRHEPVEVVQDEGGFGPTPRTLRDDGRTARILHPGLPVQLHRDEAEGYYLNLSSGQPVWFVMWRASDEDPSQAWPEQVTLSYHEAGRLLDAQEHVDNLPLPPEVAQWLQEYVDLHYRPEPKKRRRPASFVDPDKR